MIIADFGLASFIEDGKKLNLGVGSPGYVAPEIFSKKPYDKKVDMFSVGAILYEMLSGVKAFRGRDLKQL